MERTQLFDLMGELKLFGMKAAFDEIMATAVKRQHEPHRIVGDLLNAEISEKQARSISTSSPSPSFRSPRTSTTSSSRARRSTKRSSTTSPAAASSPSNATPCWSVGPVTGKTHLAIAIARSCIRGGARGRFYNVVDLVNRLETETRADRQGRLAAVADLEPDGQWLIYRRYSLLIVGQRDNWSMCSRAFCLLRVPSWPAQLTPGASVYSLPRTNKTSH